MRQRKSIKKIEWVCSLENGTLKFNPEVPKTPASPSSPTEGTISTYLYLENGVQQVGINRSTDIFNKAVEKRSCSNPKRVLNEVSYKHTSSYNSKWKAIHNTHQAIQDENSQSTNIEAIKFCFNKVLEHQKSSYSLVNN